MVGNHGVNKGTRKEVLRVIQVKEDVCLMKDTSCKGGEKWLNFGLF